VEHLAQTIRTIAASTGRAKSLVDAVHKSSQEQTQGIEHIASAIVHMDRVTQSTAASAEESASASQQLSAQAAGFKDAAAGLEKLVG
jgi:methyl-accepting chemotaxis protein